MSQNKSPSQLVVLSDLKYEKILEHISIFFALGLIFQFFRISNLITVTLIIKTPIRIIKKDFSDH